MPRSLQATASHRCGCPHAWPGTRAVCLTPGLAHVAMLSLVALPGCLANGTCQQRGSEARSGAGGARAPWRRAE
eukprot:4660401-Alexandrium_andersonii.AAC.1